MRKTDVTPVDLRITMDGKTACVTLGHAAHVAVVDVRTRKVQGYILVGKRSWGLGRSAEKTLYVANGFGDDVTDHGSQDSQGHAVDPARPHSAGRRDR
jgi:DNA-binding beta-propeller fold protein YncE